MSTKIPVTKQELIVIANKEFINEPIYKPHLKITNVEMLGDSLKFDIPITSDDDFLPILNSQEFVKRLSDKYIITD
jgi:hypothetical protein